VITGYDTRAALAYLLDGDRLAVLPSLVENSPLSILELIGASVPFLASTAGGIPESINQADQVPPEGCCIVQLWFACTTLCSPLPHRSFTNRVRFASGRCVVSSGAA
jgi:glycosyltransferase involved in cell wall biosynthesis